MKKVVAQLFQAQNKLRTNLIRKVSSFQPIHDVSKKSEILQTHPITEHNKNLKNAIYISNEEDQWNHGNSNYVLFKEVENNGLITLNRPEALNALDYFMLKQIHSTLKKWEVNKNIVIVEGAGDKAFCSGGDVKLMKFSISDNAPMLRQQFFGTGYKVAYVVGTYKIPYIVLMNNITMGAGASLSIHGKYRIVTEKSIFAMPEVALGFYPDAGSTYVLPRLKNYVGFYLGLTASALKGIDLLHSGLATHYVPAEKLSDLKQKLLLSKTDDIEEVIGKYQPDLSKCKFSLEPHLRIIEHCFSAPTIEQVIIRLENDGSAWAKKIVQKLNQMSPTSMKVTHCAFQKGYELSFKECMKMEFKLSSSLSTSCSDFYEGARAKFFDKDNKPQWDPKYLKDVKMENIMRSFDPQDINLDI